MILSQAESTADTTSTTRRTRKIGPHSLGNTISGINQCKSCSYCQYPKVIEPYRRLKLNPYLFVGDAPGEVEDSTREPFTGPSGRLLRSIISFFLPPEKYWVCNTLLCTPFNEDHDIIPPSHIDTLRCSHNLLSFIEVLSPRCIIALGKTASKTLSEFNIPHKALVHPSFILRNGGQHSITGIRFTLELERIVEQHG